MKKHKLVFLDVETTDLGDEDRLIQVALRAPFLQPDPICELFKPPVPISLEAMAVHHITEKMVADKPVFIGSALHFFLVDLFHEKNAILVAHNAEFDKEMLNREGVHPQKVICTMKVQKVLDKEEQMSQYKMQYLRYFHGFEIEAGAHDAADDILVLEALFDHLNKEVSVEEMIRMTEEPFLLRSLTFGKHKGVPLDDVPRDYLMWLRSQDNIEGDLLYTLNYYLNKKEQELRGLSRKRLSN